MNVIIENDNLNKIPFESISKGDYFLYDDNTEQKLIPFKRVSESGALALGMYHSNKSEDFSCSIGRIMHFYRKIRMIAVNNVDFYPFGKYYTKIDECMRVSSAKEVECGTVILFNNIIYMKAWDNTFIPIYDLKNQSNNCSLSHLSKVMPSDDVIILNNFQFELHINGRF